MPPLQAMYGFGDAVCVPAVAWIDRHVLTPVYEKATRKEAAARTVSLSLHATVRPPLPGQPAVQAR